MQSLEEALRPGSVSTGSLTVTETHIVIGAGLIGGFQAAHVDHSYARKSGLKGPILHGSLTAAIMSSVIGRYLPAGGWNFLEQSTRYRAPVHAGDTLTSEWIVVEHLAKASLNGVIVEFSGNCINQSGSRVAEATARILWKHRNVPLASSEAP